MNKIKQFVVLCKRALLNAAYVDDHMKHTNGMIQNLKNQFKFELKCDKLEELALNDNSLGVDKSHVTKYGDVIVSLTTHGKRIFSVFRTIESIFQQTCKANRVILWLGDEEFKSCSELPLLLQRQSERGLEIRFVKDIRSYTKLIPALQEFQDSTIVTIDDDIIYPVDLIERLVAAHLRHPGCVCANVVRRIVPDGHKSFQPYRSNELENIHEEVSSPFFVAEGFGGVLYPPKCFTSEVFREDVFLKLAPTADDLWFKAMELLSGTKVYPLKTVEPIWSRILVDEHSQDVGLINGNIHKGANDIQLKALFDYYNLYDLLEETN